MAYIFSFEKLNVWVESKELIKDVYMITKCFPKEERFGLTNQLRRATVSVASNLAEGTSRGTKRDKARFTTMAYSSLMEVMNQLIIANELDLLETDEYSRIRKDIAKIANMINALRKSQIRT